MSIKLRFEKRPLVTEATLKDEALPGLLEIISKHQIEDATIRPLVESMAIAAQTNDEPGNAANEEREWKEFARKWMAKRSVPELLSQIGWLKFPDRLVILGAAIEAQGKLGWRRANIEAQFRAAEEAPPANFSREMGVAIKAGLMLMLTPRSYCVSSAGWLKLYEAITNGAEHRRRRTRPGRTRRR